MNKRLAKRHRRHVSRARARVHISEPDIRTPEQIKAARSASRPADPMSVYRDIGQPHAGNSSKAVD